MPHIKRREYKKTKIEIIPMIDTMFFLLVFFILMSLDIVDMKGTKVNLPTAETREQQAPAKLTITIKEPTVKGGEAEIWVNKTKNIKDPATLSAVLLEEFKNATDKNGKSLRPEDDASLVVINADKKAPYSMIRTAIVAARKVKFRRFAIATDPKEDVLK